MVQEAEALEKPGRPTFFETPAWSFNMGMKVLLVGLLSVKKRRAWVHEGLGTSTTLHARHLWGRWESSSRSAAGHAARAVCFFTLTVGFRRTFSVLV